MRELIERKVGTDKQTLGRKVLQLTFGVELLTCVI